ncbi:glycosyltransferase [Paraburkholderia kirstenboschensis]|uniref:Glycosyltransferase n=1 Tax=Paraburkholderia kirstenboschensis TaxID=1245436 RepID=A0ABZ0ECV4_9BURK|nr:glycosyltransferase [Paraburkholderia kirstenboschensis]WOD14033.1 glycosyltransferase [Paraburkholderia kirstenboschensis]
MKVTAVVVTRNRPNLLGRVLNALFAQSRPPDEIIVFDNASDQATQDMLMERRGLTVLRSEYNVGGAGGFAQALQTAVARGADWVWLLDDDAVPLTHALQRLLAARPHLPDDTGALCSTVEEFDAIALQHRRYFDPLFGRERTVAAAAYSERAVGIDTGSFVGFLVSAHAVGVAGLPRSDYFIAYDDTEYSLRLKASGFTLWLVPASRIKHLRQAESRMRHHAFGVRHYYNVRNRIAVATMYSRWRLLAAVRASLIGVALWAISSHPWQLRSMAMMCRAVADGNRGKLGELGGSSSTVAAPTLPTSGY